MFQESELVDLNILYKFLRWIQMILCGICAGCALHMFISLRHMVLIVVVITLIVSFAFLLICMVDLFSMYLFSPISWTSWILFSMVAAMFFMLCCGLILTRLVMVGFIYAITGVAFLINAVLLLWLSKSDKKIEATSREVVRKRGSTPKEKVITTEQRAVSIETQEIACLQIGVQCAPGACPRYRQETETTPPKKAVKRTIKEEPKVAPSYGGTFHVSKDVAPLYSSKPTNRTVAVSTRLVPKTPPAFSDDSGTHALHVCENSYCPNKSAEPSKIPCHCCHPYGYHHHHHHHQYASQMGVQSTYSTPIQSRSPQSRNVSTHSSITSASPRLDTNAKVIDRNDAIVESEDYVGRQMYITPHIPSECPCNNCIATRLAVSLINEGTDSTLLPGEADRTYPESSASIGQQCQIGEKSSYQTETPVTQRATTIDMGKQKEPTSHLVPIYFRKRQKTDEEIATEKSRSCRVQ